MLTNVMTDFLQRQGDKPVQMNDVVSGQDKRDIGFHQTNSDSMIFFVQ